MSINSLDFQARLTGELDKAIVQKSVVSFLIDNVMRQKFVGARDVLIPDMELQGLGKYDRDGGFARGSVKVDQKTYTLSQDRARSFSIDREDMDETGIAVLAGQVMGEFVRTKVVPEVDAYTLSKLAKAAVDNSNTVALEDGETISSNCFKLVSKAIDKINDVVGFDGEIVVFVNPTVYSALMGTDELTRQLVLSDFKKGEINTRVQMLNNAAIIPVPSNRMKSAYTFNDGTTVGQEDGGFAAAAGAKDIGILALPKKSALLVKKTEKIRTFTPDQNQIMDAYKFDYRLYYDAFVKNSQIDSIVAYTY